MRQNAAPIITAALCCFMAACREEPEPAKHSLLSPSTGTWAKSAAFSKLNRGKSEASPPPPGAAAARARAVAASRNGDPPRRPKPKPQKTQRHSSAARKPRPSVPEKPDPLEHPSKPDNSDQDGVAHEKKRAEGRPDSDDGYRLRRAGLDSGYLSPKALQQRSIDAKAPQELKILEGSSEEEVLVSTAPPRPLEEAVAVADLNASAVGAMISDPTETGSFRIQISDSESFERILFDKVYLSEERINVRRDLLSSGLAPRAYWARVAFIDLLDYQQPYSAPRKVRLKR